MTTVRHGAKMTLQEYRDLGPVDEGVWELAEGVLFEMAPPNWEHQSLVDFLVMMINTFLAASDPLPGWAYSGIGVVLSESTAPTPDMVYVRAERGHLIQGSFVEGVPDVVVEVMSQDRRTGPGDETGLVRRSGRPRVLDYRPGIGHHSGAGTGRVGIRGEGRAEPVRYVEHTHDTRVRAGAGAVCLTIRGGRCHPPAGRRQVRERGEPLVCPRR